LFLFCFFYLEHAFNLQVDQIKELLEAVIRGKMRELDPKEKLLDEDEDDVISSAKSENKSRCSTKSSSSTAAGYGVAGPSNTNSLPHSEPGDSIEDAILISSDVSVKEEPGTRKDNKHHRQSRRDNQEHKKRRRSKSTEFEVYRKVPKYLYTLDIDKDLLTALRVSVFLYLCNF
jgi:hypothetical protein